jgi:hypothetical protein
MKKLYFLAAILSIGFVNTSLAQYTAIRSGTWSNPTTWDPSGLPSTVCNNCTVTINSGVTVQLDVHVELAGSSFLYIGNGGSGIAEITIGNSSQTTINTGYNIVMDTLPGNSMIVFRTSNSIIDASAAGPYDGVFAGPFPNSEYAKVIGNAPLLFQGNTPIVTSAPKYQVLSGPVTLFSGGTLPLTLTSFNAVINDNITSVSWSTAQESNLNSFAIMRSGDGSTWEQIGTVRAKGTSSVTTDYSFTDQSPLQGNNYYRLKAIDNDARFSFSEIRLVKGLFIKGIKFGPNPAISNLRITFGSNISSNLSIRLINELGQIMQVKQLSSPAGASVLLSVANYPRGLYTINIKADDGSQNTFRIMVSH